jgi:hypothetical protein
MPDRLLLCTDLDRTLLPNGAEPESPGSRERFQWLSERERVSVAYVTGRDRALVEDAIETYRLPVPDFAITDVGTRIYRVGARRWQAWQEWDREIDTDWAGLGHTQLCHMLADLAPLRLQEPAKQNTHKLSYYVPVDLDRERLDTAIQGRLGARGVRASRVWSVDEPAGVGLLDIVPERATKLHAIEFLRSRLGLSRRQTLFAGDSGNDLVVLASAIPSVAVANTAREVRETARALAEAAGNTPALYLARGGFLHMNGNYSAGILEGVAHFHPELVRFMTGRDAPQGRPGDRDRS